MRCALLRLGPAILLFSVGSTIAGSDQPASHATPPNVFDAASMDARSVGGNVVPPKIVDRPKPDYPLSRGSRVGGKVVLDAIIDEQGYVPFVRVGKGSGRAELDEAALEAVKRWRYEPARVDGVPVRVRFTVVVTFDPRERMDPTDRPSFPPEYVIEDH